MILRVSDKSIHKNTLDPQQSVGRDSKAGFTLQDHEAPGLMHLVQSHKVLRPGEAPLARGPPMDGAWCMP